MFRFTFKKALGLAAIAAAACLAVAGTASASNYPTYTPHVLYCALYGGQIFPHFELHAADPYPNLEDRQRVWARARVHDYTRGNYSQPTNWFYGTAADYRPPLQWTDATTGQTSLDAFGPSTWFNIFSTGTYRVELQFAWDQGSTGAPAGSTGWITEPGICIF